MRAELWEVTDHLVKLVGCQREQRAKLFVLSQQIRLIRLERKMHRAIDRTVRVPDSKQRNAREVLKQLGDADRGLIKHLFCHLRTPPYRTKCFSQKPHERAKFGNGQEVIFDYVVGSLSDDLTQRISLASRLARFIRTTRFAALTSSLDIPSGAG